MANDPARVQPPDSPILQVELEELRRRCASAESANEAKSVFLATMSHEIREPMNGVLGMARLLLETPLGEDQKGFVEAIHDSGQALLTIINDILDLSRMEAGRLELDRIDFDLANLLERVKAIVEPRAREKGLRLEIDLPADVPRALEGDPGRLRQIFLNLLGNAIKFTAQGEVRLQLQLIEENAATARLGITVSDSGIGIPKHLQARLFEPYAQADPTVPRLYGGSGLGLTICARLVELMGGTISLDSAPGHGTTFELALTLAKTPAGRTAKSPSTADIAGLRLLVVDPNETTRTMLQQQTESWGITAAVEGAGEAALATLRAAAERGQPIEVALIDRFLPDMSGEELGRRIKAEPALQACRLVMVSSSGLRGDAARVSEIGFAAYLPKPITATTLLDCLLQLHGAGPCHPTGSAGLITVHSMSERRPASLKILLADDNPVNCRIAVLMLEKAGHRIDVVEDGVDAVAAVEEKDYDLVLMDVQMPRMSGLEATERIRALPVRSDVPVIAITANAMKGDDERCFAAGMSDYITKPIDRARLLSKVAEWGYAKASA